MLELQAIRDGQCRIQDLVPSLSQPERSTLTHEMIETIQPENRLASQLNVTLEHRL